MPETRNLTRAIRGGPGIVGLVVTLVMRERAFSKAAQLTLRLGQQPRPGNA
jgi:hypothetical protein